LTIARRPLGRVLTAVAFVAAAVSAVPPTQAVAPAAGCSSASGVTVVVDFNELGGGVPSVCDADGGGKKAATLFPQNGFKLEYAVGMAGFVCRVQDAPAPEDEDCQGTAPGNAYWSLWWSDGKTGSWSYASSGAGSLTVPDGGYVAFSWDQSDGTAPPSFNAAKHAAPPPPASSPGGNGNGGGAGNSNGGGQSSGAATADGGGQGGGATTGPGASSSATPSSAPSASASAAPGKRGKPGSPAKSRKPSTRPAPSASPSPTESTAAADGELTGAAPTAAEPQDGLPAFVAPVLIGTLFGVAGIVFLLRRRSGPA
jgi:hypothetical protein